jgi:hypothetical protein
MIFTDLLEAERYVTEALLGELPKSEAETLAQNFVLVCQGYDGSDWPNDYGENQSISVGGVGADFGDGPWTVSKEGLSELKEILFKLGLIEMVPSQGRPLHVAELVMSCVYMLWRLRKKGVRPDPLQSQILLALRQRKALTAEALTEAVKVHGQDWTLGDVKTALSELGAVRLNDGTVEPLVHRDHHGEWSTSARGLWQLTYFTFRGSVHDFPDE